MKKLEMSSKDDTIKILLSRDMIVKQIREVGVVGNFKL